LARLFYVQAFNEDFDKTLCEKLNPSSGFSEIIDILLKTVWAMNKAANFAAGSPTSDYPQWKSTMGVFDLSECIDALMEEIETGFIVKRVYKVEKEQKRGADKNGPQKVLAVALKMGMSMRDLNELTTQTLIDVIHEFAGGSAVSGDDERAAARMGTPKEAVSFFLGR
jgi:hypothetical protein